MRYLCTLEIRKKKFLRSFRLVKKKFFVGAVSHVVRTTDLENQIHKIYPLFMLSYSHIFNFCVTSLKTLPSWSK